MAGILDWLLGPGQGPTAPTNLLQQQGQPMQQGQAMPQGQSFVADEKPGGILTRMGDALIGMGDPYGMMDKNSMTPEQRQQMIGQALLQMGTGIASSRERNPLGALGQGMQYAQRQGQQTGDNRLKGLMYKSQIGKLEGENRTKEYLRSRPKPASFGGSDDDWRLFVDSNPGEAFKLVSERGKPSMYRYDENGNVVVDPIIRANEIGLAHAKRPVSNTTVINAGETEGAKQAAKDAAEFYGKMQSAASSVPIKMANLEQLNALLDQVNTGAWTGTIQQFKAAAKRFGVDLNELGVSDDVGPAQAAQALSNKIALDSRSTAEGAGMPGSMSDSDREFLVQMNPTLATTPEGRKLMVSYQRRVMQFQRAQAKAVQDYVRSRKGVADYGVYDVARKFAEENPIFKPEDFEAINRLSARPATTLPPIPQGYVPLPN